MWKLTNVTKSDRNLFKFWSCKGFSHLQIDDFITKDGLGLPRSVLDFFKNMGPECITDHFEFQIRVKKPTAKSASHHSQTN